MAGSRSSDDDFALDPSAVDETSFAFGRYTIDTRTKRLLCDGRVVPLTTKAFETLEVLVRAAGQTVSKDHLLKQVWPGTFVQEDTLAQNISTIRRALGETADSPRHVLTVPREGYRFVAPVEAVPAESAGSDGPVRLPFPRPHQVPLTRTGRWMLPFTIGAVSGAALAAFAFLWLRAAAPKVAGPPTTFEIYEPEGARFSTSGGALALSPDGRTLVFLAEDANRQDRLWIRPVDSREGRPLPGTEDASQPFWSADGRSIAFFARGALRKVDISGGDAHTICQLSANANALAGSWSSRGLILFSLQGAGLLQVRATGGNATPLTLRGLDNCTACLWPVFLPDGQHFLFTLARAAPDRGIYIASLDGGEPRRVLGEVSSTAFTSDGYLIYVAAGALVARRFDYERARVVGEVLPLADQVWVNPITARASFAASNAGVIAYREPLITRLEWISRAGEVVSTGPQGAFLHFSVSPRGDVLVSRLDPRYGTYNLWLHDPAWKTATRLTFDPGSDFTSSTALWSDDGTRIVFARDRGPDGWQLLEMAINRPGEERPLLDHASPETVTPIAWRDGIVYYSASWSRQSASVWQIDARQHGPTPSAAVTHQGQGEQRGQISPDGAALAYTANIMDSRVPHGVLFVRPWPNGAGRSEIASEGSVPRWRRDGGELFFLAPGGRLMTVAMRKGQTAGAPQILCATEALAPSGLAGDAYDAAPDGQRFLVKVPARRPSIVVMSGVLTSGR